MRGPNVLYPGLSYIFYIEIEKFGHYLSFIPYTTVNGIKFDPSILVFNDYFEYKK